MLARPSRRTLLAILVASLVSTSSAVGWTQSRGSQRNETQRALDRAVALFEAQDYAAALQQFQELYVRTRQPELLYNIGIAQERLGHRDEALRALHEYLDRVPQSPHRAAVEEHIRTLEESLRPAASPSPPPTASPPPVSSAAPIEPERHVRRRPLIPAAALAGVGVVSFILAPIFWALRNDAIAPCTPDGNTLVCPTQAAADHAADGRTYTALTDVALGVGVAGVAAGVLLYVFGGHDEVVRPGHARIEVMPTSSGLSLGIAGTL